MLTQEDPDVDQDFTPINEDSDESDDSDQIDDNGFILSDLEEEEEEDSSLIENDEEGVEESDIEDSSLIENEEEGELDESDVEEEESIDGVFPEFKIEQSKKDVDL